MKAIIILLTLIIIVVSLPVQASAKDVRVKGYYRDSNRDGLADTYVQPHHRTAPDSNPYNNYSSPGRYNPNTGHINPYNNNYYDSYRYRNRYR